MLLNLYTRFEIKYNESYSVRKRHYNISLLQYIQSLYWPPRILMVALAEFPDHLEAYTAGTGAHTRHGHNTYGDHIPSNIRGPECQQNGRPFENYQYRPTDCCETQPIHLITNSAMRNRRL